MRTTTMRREWLNELRKLQTIDAKVIEQRAIRRTANGRPTRWAVTVESALGRRATSTALTPGSAMRHARLKLGYRDLGRALVLDDERAVQTRLP